MYVLAMFENKKLCLKKLLSFGFAMDNGAYTYTTNIVNGQF
jgi:hypothetical protein